MYLRHRRKYFNMGGSGYTVAGSGYSTFNGDYEEDGTYNSKTRWKHTVNNAWLVSSSDSGVWCFSETNNPSNDAALLYKMTSVTALPSTDVGDWEYQAFEPVFTSLTPT